MAAIELSGYVLQHFKKASASAEHGLIADLAARSASGELEQTPALAIMLTLFGAAGESTASLLGSAAWILADRPEIQHQLRENPGLLGIFIEETLRFESPFRGHYRHVLRDTSLAGIDLPAKSRLLLMWGAANSDGSGSTGSTRQYNGNSRLAAFFRVFHEEMDVIRQRAKFKNKASPGATSSPPPFDHRGALPGTGDETQLLFCRHQIHWQGPPLFAARTFQWIEVFRGNSLELLGTPPCSKRRVPRRSQPLRPARVD